MEVQHSLRVHRLLPVAVLAVLIVVGMTHPVLVQADGGGFPTRTPTRTLIPIFPTVTSSGPQLRITFPATATSTQVAGVIGQQAQPQAGQAAPQSGLATQAARPFSLLSCWPFALVVLMILVVGVMWLNSRRQGTP